MEDKKTLNNEELEKINGGEQYNRESAVLCDCGCKVILIDGYGVCRNCGNVYNYRDLYNEI